VTLLHLSRHDFYRMNPGLLFDLVQIHNERYGKKKEAELD